MTHGEAAPAQEAAQLYAAVAARHGPDLHQLVDATAFLRLQSADIFRHRRGVRVEQFFGVSLGGRKLLLAAERGGELLLCLRVVGLQGPQLGPQLLERD